MFPKIRGFHPKSSMKRIGFSFIFIIHFGGFPPILVQHPYIIVWLCLMFSLSLFALESDSSLCIRFLFFLGGRWRPQSCRAKQIRTCKPNPFALPETNIAPERWWLAEFPFGMASWQVLCYICDTVVGRNPAPGMYKTL